MQKERYNILVIGSYSSGSSAVLDLLREYDNINVFTWEFDDFRAPGLVADQLSAIASRDYPNRIEKITKIGDPALRLIFKITPKIFWEKDWNFSAFKYLKSKGRIMRLNQIHFLKELNKNLKSETSFDERIKNSNLWIRRINSINSSNNDMVVFNQPLDPYSDPEIWTKVFDPFKLIYVFRDPKDQLADLVKRGVLFSPFRTPAMTPPGVNIMSIYGRNRQGMIRFLTDALKKRITAYDNYEKFLESDQLLMIDFEGLVKQYDLYKTVIENFLGISKMNHKLRYNFFNPEMSKNNIDIYANYLNEDELSELSDLEIWYNQKISINDIKSKVKNLNSLTINE